MESKIFWQIGSAFANRLTINTARRFVYPFAPVLSRGLGVPLTAITSLIAVNQVTGIFSLLFGPLGDRWGYRTMLLLGLATLSVGMLMAGVFPFYATVLVGVFLAGLAKSMFDPSILAFAGKQVPYQRRGLAIGILEMSWAASSLAGIPLIGLLIERFGWRSPFFVLGGLGIIGGMVLMVVMPRERTHTASAAKGIQLRKAWGMLAREKSALGALGFALCICGANDNLFVIYGVWLEKSFGLTVVALGLATTVIGAAELAGEGLIAALADRLGLKQSVILGAVLAGLSYAALPILNQSLPLALTGLFLTFLTVEFTIVASISFFTEVLPDARGTMMAGYLAAASIGRVCGALLSGPLWLLGGLPAIGAVSAVITGLGLVSLLWGLHHREPALDGVEEGGGL